MSHTSASVEDLCSALADNHEVSRVVSTQIMSWFGEIRDGKWKMDVDLIVKEMGLGILRNHRVSWRDNFHDIIISEQFLPSMNLSRKTNCSHNGKRRSAMHSRTQCH